MSKESTMKISVFIEKYNELSSDTAKTQFVKKIVKTNYAGIVAKRAILQNSVNKSVIDKGSIVYVDSLTSKINFAVSIVLLYTILEFDKKESGEVDVFGGYDLLMKNNIFDAIIAIVGESEIEELAGVHSSLLDNFYNENSSTQATLIRQINLVFKTFSGMLNKLLETVDKTLSDEKVVNVINNAINKHNK